MRINTLNMYGIRTVSNLPNNLGNANRVSSEVDIKVPRKPLVRA